MIFCLECSKDFVYIETGETLEEIFNKVLNKKVSISIKPVKRVCDVCHRVKPTIDFESIYIKKIERPWNIS